MALVSTIVVGFISIVGAAGSCTPLGEDRFATKSDGCCQPKAVNRTDGGEGLVQFEPVIPCPELRDQPLCSTENPPTCWKHQYVCRNPIPGTWNPISDTYDKPHQCNTDLFLGRGDNCTFGYYPESWSWKDQDCLPDTFCREPLFLKEKPTKFIDAARRLDATTMIAVCHETPGCAGIEIKQAWAMQMPCGSYTMTMCKDMKINNINSHRVTNEGGRKYKLCHLPKKETVINSDHGYVRLGDNVYQLPQLAAIQQKSSFGNVQVNGPVQDIHMGDTNSYDGPGAQVFQGPVEGAQVQGSYASAPNVNTGQFKTCEGSGNGREVGAADTVCCESQGAVCCASSSYNAHSTKATDARCPSKYPFLKDWDSSDVLVPGTASFAVPGAESAVLCFGIAAAVGAALVRARRAAGGITSDATVEDQSDALLQL